MPLDPIGVLREALYRCVVDDRLLLLGRCIEWLDRALREGRIEPSLETEEAMEDWLCDECALENQSWLAATTD